MTKNAELGLKVQDYVQLDKDKNKNHLEYMVKRPKKNWFFSMSIGEEMTEDKRKFYYYRIKGKQERRWAIDIFNEINQVDLLNNDITVEAHGFSYTFELEKIGDLFFGTVTKSKGANNYEFREASEHEWKNLEEKAGEGYAREFDTGVSYFVIGKEDTDLIALVQKGYQTSGIDKIISFFNEFFKSKDIKVKKELLKTQKSIEAIKKIITQDTLISIDVKLKRDEPEIPEEYSDIMKALYKLHQEGIQLYFGARAISTQDGIVVKAKEIVEKFIKIPHLPPSQDIIDAFFEQDLNEMFDSINVVVNDIETGAEKKQDLLDDLEHEKINITREVPRFTEAQKQKLCNHLIKKIELLESERNGRA